MSFYVSRWPDQCDPRNGHMGHEVLNGIQTPPARIWFEKRLPIFPGSIWQYNGPLGTGLQLPEAILPFITLPCERRFVTWEVVTTLDTDPGSVPLVIRIEKREASGPNPFAYDSYWIQLTIDGVASDDPREYRQLHTFDYSRYEPFIVNIEWVWGGLMPFQTVTSTFAWPIAWNRTTPGPPFIPGI